MALHPPGRLQVLRVCETARLPGLRAEAEAAREHGHDGTAHVAVARGLARRSPGGGPREPLDPRRGGLGRRRGRRRALRAEGAVARRGGHADLVTTCTRRRSRAERFDDESFAEDETFIGPWLAPCWRSHLFNLQARRCRLRAFAGPLPGDVASVVDGRKLLGSAVSRVRMRDRATTGTRTSTRNTHTSMWIAVVASPTCA
mmetsp:Transcript_65332/g.211627  ORF Transcript_65332/g.211627 Transcript_65332/m.211627 type:complete len:201 (-) Transcript_65332:123-725(-)